MRKIPYGYCHCGCGNLTNLSTLTYKKKGLVKGKPRRFLHGHNSYVISKATKLKLRKAQEWRRTEPIQKFWNLVDIKSPEECWEWQGYRDRKGYGSFNPAWEGYPLKVRAHRFSYLITKGEIPKGKIVAHGCDNPPCCNPAHLSAKTYKENTQEMLERGRQRITNCEHPLNAQEVREMRSLYPEFTLKEISERYHTTIGNVWYVVNYKTWKHIT